MLVICGSYARLKTGFLADFLRGISGEFQQISLVRFSGKIGRVATRLEKSSRVPPAHLLRLRPRPGISAHGLSMLLALYAPWIAEIPA